MAVFSASERAVLPSLSSTLRRARRCPRSLPPSGAGWPGTTTTFPHLPPPPPSSLLPCTLHTPRPRSPPRPLPLPARTPLPADRSPPRALGQPLPPLTLALRHPPGRYTLHDPLAASSMREAQRRACRAQRRVRRVCFSRAGGGRQLVSPQLAAAGGGDPAAAEETATEPRRGGAAAEVAAAPEHVAQAVPPPAAVRGEAVGAGAVDTVAGTAGRRALWRRLLRPVLDAGMTPSQSDLLPPASLVAAQTQRTYLDPLRRCARTRLTGRGRAAGARRGEQGADFYREEEELRSRGGRAQANPDPVQSKHPARRSDLLRHADEEAESGGESSARCGRRRGAGRLRAPRPSARDRRPAAGAARRHLGGLRDGERAFRRARAGGRAHMRQPSLPSHSDVLPRPAAGRATVSPVPTLQCGKSGAAPQWLPAPAGGRYTSVDVYTTQVKGPTALRPVSTGALSADPTPPVVADASAHGKLDPQLADGERSGASLRALERAAMPAAATAAGELGALRTMNRSPDARAPRPLRSSQRARAAAAPPLVPAPVSVACLHAVWTAAALARLRPRRSLRRNL